MADKPSLSEKFDEVVPLPEDLDQEVNKILDAAAAELVN
jgi:hypothetical protein